MTENKRFTVENNDGEVCIKDNLTKKYPFAYVCETIDMKEAMISECLECSNLLNQMWEQTQRFEKYNQEYLEERNTLHERIQDLEKKEAELGQNYLRLLEENLALREALKNEYVTEICEKCKHADYICTNDYMGFEWDRVCKKGLNHDEEVLECDDFELNFGEEKND